MEKYNDIEFWKDEGFMIIDLEGSEFSFVPLFELKPFLELEGFNLSDEVFCSEQSKLVDLVSKDVNGKILSSSYELFVPIQIITHFIDKVN